MSRLLILLGIFAQTEGVSPDLIPVSRNPVVFIESSAPGEEWEAYRLCDANRPAVLRATGPGKLLLKVRTFVGGDPAVGAVLVEDRIVLTARVEAERDLTARAADDPRALSKVHFYLIKVPAGDNRVTVRYSEGGALLVSATLTPVSPSELLAGDEGEIPLVAPSAKGRVQRTDVALDKPTVNKEALGEAVVVPTKEPESRTGPREEEAVIPKRFTRGSIVRRPLTLPAPYLTLEMRGGLKVSGLDVGPSLDFGLSARFAVPRMDPRVFTLGVSGDLWTGIGEKAVRTRSGAITDVAEVAQTAAVLGVDFRWSFLRVEDAFEVYASGGLGGLLGSMSVSNRTSVSSALSLAALAQLRLGVTHGTDTTRPFLEAATYFGRYGSRLLAEEDMAYGAMVLLLGYRGELIADTEVD